METNELMPLQPVAAPPQAESPTELLLLLAERTKRYTMGDSTSVPTETAQRLLGGILYCIDLHCRSKRLDTPLEAPLPERFAAGAKEAKRLTRRGKLLLKEAQRWQPPVLNTGFSDTLASLPAFFRAYNTDFFAQEIPCDIDYPLCQPVSDQLVGVEYMLSYLRRLLTESTLLRVFAPEALRSLYERYYGDYVDLLVNLYAPAAEAAVLCVLAGKSALDLTLTPSDQRAVYQALAQSTDAAAKEAMHGAAKLAAYEMHISGAFARAYLEQTAMDLLTRLRVVPNS
jgi:hypothetical protein